MVACYVPDLGFFDWWDGPKKANGKNDVSQLLLDFNNADSEIMIISSKKSGYANIHSCHRVVSTAIYRLNLHMLTKRMGGYLLVIKY